MEAERVYKNNCSRTIEKVKGRGTYQLVDNRKHTCAMVNRPVVQMNPITSHLYTLMSWATSHPVVSIGAVVLVGGTSLVFGGIIGETLIGITSLQINGKRESPMILIDKL